MSTKSLVIGLVVGLVIGGGAVYFGRPAMQPMSEPAGGKMADAAKMADAGGDMRPSPGEVGLENAAGAITYRKKVMDAIGGHMGAMATIIKGEGGNAADLPIHAEALAQLAIVAQGVFPKGSGPDSGDTKILAKTWDNWDEFKKGLDALKTESAKLVEVSQTGDRQAFAAQLGALGKNGCKACHDNFKTKN